MLRALHLAIRGRDVHLEVSSTRSFVDKFREVSLSFVGGRRWHLHKSETNAKKFNAVLPSQSATPSTKRGRLVVAYG